MERFQALQRALHGLRPCTLCLPSITAFLPRLSGGIPSNHCFACDEHSEISSACLTGLIPSDLSLLRSLSSFTLSTGDFSRCSASQLMTASFPDWISTLPKLQTLVLDVEGLSGEITNDIGALYLLRTLQISGPNLMTQIPLAGTVPVSLMNCTELQVLDIERTSLNFFGSSGTHLFFPRLTYLSLANSTNLVIPKIDLESLFQGAVGLEYIELTNVPITFDLAVLYDLPALTILDLSGTQLNYFLTSQFWRSLPGLKYLSLANCPNLLGGISSEISKMTQLGHLDLSGSQIGDTIPSEIGSLPLNALLLADTYIEKPFPDSISQLNATLTRLVINGLPIGTQEIPHSWGALHRLIELDLSGNGLNGTIPRELGNSYTLKILRLDNNLLTGSIPSFNADHMVIDLHNNQLTGTVPDSLVSSPYEINLSYNFLGPRLPLLITVDNIVTARLIDFSHNRFHDVLPHIQVFQDPTLTVETVNFGFNQITGTIPTSYCKVRNLHLDHNNLTGLITDFTSECAGLKSLVLNHNSLSGTVPDLRALIGLKEIDISDNHFTGSLPLIPSGLISFIASNNAFDNAHFMPWAANVAAGALERLDISHNGLVVQHPFSILIGANLTYLTLAGNQFANIPDIGYFSPFGLTGLDLSYMQLSGRFRAELFPKLSYLNLKMNQFQGIVDFEKMPSLVVVNMAQNLFRFDAATMPSLPQLTTLDLHDNIIYGSLVLDGMFNLQSADFSNNGLNYPPDLATIGDLFTRFKLQLLNITDNPQLEIFTKIDTASTGLHRAPTSFASAHYSKQVKCYELTFNNKSHVTFLFDEGLFSYLQCDCNEQNFGFPPFDCHHCPSSGTDSCGGTSVNVSRNQFAIALPVKSSTSRSKISSHAAGSSSSLSNFATPIDDSPEAMEHFQLETESCLQTVLQTLAGRSNCDGVIINATQLRDTSLPIDQILHTQCRKGSDGRLCSRCICSPTGQGTCFYLRGLFCTPCRATFRLSQTLPLVFGVSTFLVLITSITMWVIMKRGIVIGLELYESLPLWERVFHRFFYLLSLGNFSILITFVQMLIEFTEWDAYVAMEFLGLLNGSVDGPLRCIFPFLSQPYLNLLLQLMTPFAAVAIVLSGGLLAILYQKIGKRLDSRKRLVLEEDTLLAGTITAIASDHTPLLLREEEKTLKIDISPRALLISSSIAAIKVFYFGAALASHRYLFWTIQQSTGLKYSLNRPWLLYSDSLPLILISMPAILIFDLVIPGLFIYLCWKVRKTSQSPKTMMYFGSLFEGYNPRVYWWELVMTIQKLWIALLIQAFPTSYAWQWILIVAILSITLVLQAYLNPWKRKIENIADNISTLLLIAALLGTRPTALSRSTDVVFFLVALCLAFMIGSIVLIAWQTWNGRTDYQKDYEKHRTKSEFDDLSPTTLGSTFY